MDDPATFMNFLTTRCGTINARSRNELVAFIPTFRSLLSVLDDDIAAFVKQTHAANTARGNNQRILISPATVLALQAILFELKDRQICDELPTAAVLNNITAAQMAAMKAQKTQAVIDASNAKAVSYPDMEVPKLTATNFDRFIIAFSAVAARTKGMYGIPIDYLLRASNGNYSDPWTTREEKLKMCVSLNGPNFQKDSQALYSLFIQYIGTEGVGSNIVNRFTRSKNGYQCYLDLDSHFRNDTHRENLASKANLSLSNVIYKGERRNFTLETYYSIMTKAFNDLALAGPTHALNEEKKVMTFEQGLRDPTAISWYITAKDRWNALPPHEQTFDAFYNEFSKYMNKFKVLSIPESRVSRIGSMDTSGRGRGRGRGNKARGRGGRGRGRGSNSSTNRHSPYSVPNTQPTSFTPEAKNYDRDVWKNLSQVQRQRVIDLKSAAGWINGYTPPPGTTLDDNGYAVPSRQISLVGSGLAPPLLPTPGTTMVPIPPPPPPRTSPVPPIIQTNANEAGSSFGRSASRQPPSDSSTIGQVSLVSINGQPYHGPIFDSNNNRIA